MHIGTKIATAAAVAGIGFGGATLANAATTSTTPSGSASPTGTQQHDSSKGGHQANGKTETLLTGDTAAKVKAAALAAVPGGTIERVETDADSSNPYEAHVTKSDGSEVQVSVDANFKVVSVNAFGGHH
ncbi:MAG: hypothetical protein AAGC46_11350 [Solirubrobacteraceae bacterium]|nr:hypothetical protein [Patulibacter sp.]